MQLASCDCEAHKKISVMNFGHNSITALHNALRNSHESFRIKCTCVGVPSNTLSSPAVIYTKLILQFKKSRFHQSFNYVRTTLQLRFTKEGFNRRMFTVWRCYCDDLLTMDKMRNCGMQNVEWITRIDREWSTRQPCDHRYSAVYQTPHVDSAMIKCVMWRRMPSYVQFTYI